MTKEDVILAKQEYEIAKMKYDNAKRELKKKNRKWEKIFDEFWRFLWVTYFITTILSLSFTFILNGIGIASKSFWSLQLGIFGISCVIYASIMMIINNIKENNKTN